MRQCDHHMPSGHHLQRRDHLATRATTHGSMTAHVTAMVSHPFLFFLLTRLCFQVAHTGATPSMPQGGVNTSGDGDEPFGESSLFLLTRSCLQQCSHHTPCPCHDTRRQAATCHVPCYTTTRH